MIVFECIGMAWHTGMRYPAHWHAVPPCHAVPLAEKTNKLWCCVFLATLKARLPFGCGCLLDDVAFWDDCAPIMKR
jgi:hypothetical protein